jgi:hypothetical protein
MPPLIILGKRDGELTGEFGAGFPAAVGSNADQRVSRLPSRIGCRNRLRAAARSQVICRDPTGRGAFDESGRVGSVIGERRNVNA